MTPWAAGLGLLVSFTASAGTESALGSSLFAAGGRVVPALPPGTGLIGAAIHRDGAGRLLIERADAIAPLRADEEPLRTDLKAQAQVYPAVQRSGKGAPVHPIRESFERRAAGLREGGAALIFGNVTGSVTGMLTPGSAVWNPDLEPEAGFVPVPDLGLGTGSDSAASTGIGRSDSTGDAEDGHRDDGSTPPVPRAVALASTTPAPADAIPVEVAAANLALPDFAPRAVPSAPQSLPEAGTSRYADLISPEAMDREQRCLAEAVYFEARGEPEAGQAAVAQVVLNRVKSGLYPTNVCGVVYQNRHRFMGCQFSFACEGRSLRITDDGSWQTATRIAQSVIAGRTYLSEVGAATHYHADYVRPGWSRRLRKMDVIGRHIFYTLRPGQT